MASARAHKGIDLKHQPGFSQIAWFCIVVLYAPIAVLVLFSFNQNRSVTVWTEFSFDWYVKAAQNEGIQHAAWISLEVAFVAMVVSTILATMAALVTTRTPPYRGLNLAVAAINQPLMVPEVVTAVATLIFFAIIKQATGVTGIGYLIAAHTAFCIPFAYMPIRARLEDMDLSLEQAAADLYAPPFKVFRRVTLPLLMPGIMAGAMLAFIVSLDDVIITLFVAGPGETTLPLYILGQIRRGVTPEINAVSTVFLGISVILVTLIFFFGTDKNKGKQ
ncbi:MAG: ABC transporter permease [Gammaproteobacteria bacterium]|nr:MAG: ABC transporter permease [Gammaproteobacteria bacterium]UCH42101.1 MAG: ABC transporter permease [Gammaproteobacteria bacterium]